MSVDARAAEAQKAADTAAEIAADINNDARAAAAGKAVRAGEVGIATSGQAFHSAGA